MPLSRIVLICWLRYCCFLSPGTADGLHCACILHPIRRAPGDRMGSFDTYMYWNDNCHRLPNDDGVILLVLPRMAANTVGYNNMNSCVPTSSMAEARGFGSGCLDRE